MTTNDWHILARPILAGFTSLLVSIVIILKPDVSEILLGFIVGAPTAYIGLKWTGKQPESKA
ncbi:MAG: hypothetical protein KJO69_02425 [Gammaproteobacteria bacterium]|nr:hypothetical protein [Gammaproteobacteria bacterium]